MKKIINDTTAIKEIVFELTVPNYFGVSGAAERLVDGAKKNINADTVKISFSNNKGKLDISDENLKSLTDYASHSGSWIIKIKTTIKDKYHAIHSSDVENNKEFSKEILDIVDQATMIHPELKYNDIRVVDEFNKLFNY